MQVSDVGPIVAQSLIQFFSEVHNIEVIRALQASGVVWAENDFPLNEKNSALTGKIFVLTGTFPSLSREAAKSLIESAGGKVSGSVSKKTDYVVAGVEAGSKLAKAEALGVTIIDEAQLHNLLDQL